MTATRSPRLSIPVSPVLLHALSDEARALGTTPAELARVLLSRALGVPVDMQVRRPRRESSR